MAVTAPPIESKSDPIRLTPAKELALPKHLRTKGRNLLRSLGRLAIAVIIISLAIFAYRTGRDMADEAGWVAHKADMHLFFGRDDWVRGEFRNCSTYPHETKMDCTPMTRLPGMTTHVVPVKFHGRINRTDHPFYTWKCQRLAESLTCWALD